jgi:hypothetical protein
MPKLEELGCNDLGNKDRFVEQHGTQVKYLVEEGTWIIWEEGRWRRSLGDVEKLAEATVKSIYDEAKRCDDTGSRPLLFRHAERSRNDGAIAAMLRRARYELGANIETFDKDA